MHITDRGSAARMQREILQAGRENEKRELTPAAPGAKERHKQPTEET